MIFQIGDIILSKNKFKLTKPMTWLAKIIQFLINGPNHVMLVIRINGRYFIAECNENGCHIELLETRLKPNESEYIVLRRKTQKRMPDGRFRVFDDKEAFEFVNNTLDQLGSVGYGVWTLIYRHFKRLIIERINKTFGTNFKVWSQKDSKYQNSFVCSEFAAFLHKDIFPHWYMANPKDLLVSSEFNHIPISKFSWWPS
jgi:hypothetical protein